MKDVVIVGCGAVCSVGLSSREIYQSFRECKENIGPLKRFDTSRLRTGVGGETDLQRVISLLETESVVVPFLREPLNLRENPKLAFALSAVVETLTGDKSLKSSLPYWTEDVALYTTAGLEKISVPALWDTVTHDNHVSPEFPPTFVGEVLASVFGFNRHSPVSIVSACASSTQSIGEAARAVADGTVEIAIAGGTDSMLFPFGINSFNSLGALAEGHTKTCRLAPFDQKRSGTLLGEGAAYILLTTTKKAAELGFTPVCSVIGYGSSLDGYHSVKPHPKGEGASKALIRALHDGNVDADTVDYINAHGSGTWHNDLVESAVIRELFPTEGTVSVSSTKPFFGHLLTAGGAIELLSCLYSFIDGVVPPTLNLDTIDEQCAIHCVGPQPETLDVKVAVSNSFGLHGQNGVLVLRKFDDCRENI